MRIALLSPGPTLARAPRVFPHHDLVLSVNRAVHHARADWWCFGDAETFWRVRPNYYPSIWTDENAAHRILKSGQAERFENHQSTLYESHFAAFPKQPDWTRFSACAALVLAAVLGGTRVDCFGVDMAGDVYSDGSRGESLNEDRWERERRLWDATVSRLNGVSVVRT